eukprot:CAMPEP_0172824696 /NCGR_PEP_ID=MMETSP1075-20121228/18172_1 /TAXON_ID=2916 /ORGANISM="Ceratium fusus, Strain PA161109" /LENGTH=121 /DNA_ID=CAMNT_0013666013 /DNA_START=278 /DNA_END=644 /DNA_ORIENTATION=-
MTLGAYDQVHWTTKCYLGFFGDFTCYLRGGFNSIPIQGHRRSGTTCIGHRTCVATTIFLQCWNIGCQVCQYDVRTTARHCHARQTKARTKLDAASANDRTNRSLCKPASQVQAGVPKVVAC